VVQNGLPPRIVSFFSVTGPEAGREGALRAGPLPSAVAAPRPFFYGMVGHGLGSGQGVPSSSRQGGLSPHASTYVMA